LTGNGRLRALGARRLLSPQGPAFYHGVDRGDDDQRQQRIAVPMIGGMVSSTLLTLIVIPAIYAVVKGWSLRRERKTAKPERAQPAVAGQAGTS